VERTLGPEKLAGLERHGLELKMNKHVSVEKQ
jgi:hypothetical protein